MPDTRSQTHCLSGITWMSWILERHERRTVLSARWSDRVIDDIEGIISSHGGKTPMCIYARYAVRVVRCMESKLRFNRERKQTRAACLPRMVRRQAPSSPEQSCAPSAPAPSALPGHHPQHHSNSLSPRPSLRNWISGDITAAPQSRRTFAACYLEPPQLWINIQDVRHRFLADAVRRCVTELFLDGAAITPRPVQLTHDGPLVDEIRYFKVADRAGALVIAKALKSVLPRLWLRDLSREYDHVANVKHGHYELWLSSNNREKDH